MLRKALFILSGNAAAFFFLLVRYLVIARLIPVADYGVAATFAMAIAVVEMASTLGLQQQIVQAKEGDDHRFQAALQGFQVFRGLLAGAGLFLVAGPLARFLGIPEVAWAYQFMALVPVLNALQHFDIHRMNRQMRFGPMLLTGAVPSVVALSIVWPLSYWFGDWRIMLWSVLAQAAFGAITSHLCAERPYRLAWDRQIIAGSLRFGWPLLLNAMLMFFVFQGDKLIVAKAMGMEALAVFSMGMTLTLTPTLVLAKSVQNLFLPKLSQARDTPQFEFNVLRTLQVVSLSALVFIFVVASLGVPFVQLVLGENYSSLSPLLIWFALAQGARLTKVGFATLALSIERTSNAMAANLVRCLALPVCWWIAQTTGNIVHILAIGMAAEMLGVFLSMWLALRGLDFAIWKMVAWQCLVALVIVAVSIVEWKSQAVGLNSMVLLTCGIGILGTYGLSTYLFKNIEKVD
jgi:O-antigen/teichoic acid export membrane protein